MDGVFGDERCIRAFADQTGVGVCVTVSNNVDCVYGSEPYLHLALRNTNVSQHYDLTVSICSLGQVSLHYFLLQAYKMVTEIWFLVRQSDDVLPALPDQPPWRDVAQSRSVPRDDAAC